MIVRARILAEHPLAGGRRLCATGYFSMVTVGTKGARARERLGGRWCRAFCWRATRRAEWAVGGDQAGNRRAAELGRGVKCKVKLT